jgi:antitoxin VapB
MALQIANPVVVAKIEALAHKTGLTKTAAVEKAVDALLNDSGSQSDRVWERFDAILAQIDQIPEISNSSDPLDWDEFGLPK